MPYFTIGSYKVEIGKLVLLMKDRGRKGGMKDLVLIKPQSSTQLTDGYVHVPEGAKVLDHRLMLAVAIGEKIDAGTDDPMKGAMGYGLMIDLMDPKALGSARRAGRPWTEACCFDGSSILSEFVHASEVEDITDREVYMEVNGEKRAGTSTRDMMMDVPMALGKASEFMSLYPGDLVCIEVLGTDGELRPGDHLEAGISTVSVLRFSVRTD